MPIELKLLVWSIALTLIQAVIAVLGAMLVVGLPALAGNRENLPAIEGWGGRAQRAHRNMLENLVLFAALVLVAQLAGKLNATTALGAQLFFWGRLGYAAVYLIGIPWLRTGVWLVSIVGLILIFLQLL
jgi:uncharacterized MAPEG superfamily protein